MDLKKYLTLLGNASAVPGGGSAAALAGAMGAALGKMVTGITPNNKIKKYQKRFNHNCLTLLSFSEKDSRAYQSVLAAYKLPKSCLRQIRRGGQTPPDVTSGRTKRIQSALHQAMVVPLNAMRICLDNLVCLDMIAPLIKPSLKSDFAVAVLLSQAGMKGCLMNVNINLACIKNRSIKVKTNKQVKLLNQKMNIVSKRLTRYLWQFVYSICYLLSVFYR